MKKAILFSAIITTCIALPIHALVGVGEPAPVFIVADGNDGILDSDKPKGRVIAGFYENRGQIEENRQIEVILANKATNQKGLNEKCADNRC